MQMCIDMSALLLPQAPLRIVRAGVATQRMVETEVTLTSLAVKQESHTQDILYIHPPLYIKFAGLGGTLGGTSIQDKILGW